jgi:hypothetical protein
VNSGIITFSPLNLDDPALYVQENGDRPSVIGFLSAAKILRCPDPAKDPGAALGALAFIAGLHLGTKLAIGLVRDMTADNGIWVIGEDWALLRNGLAVPERIIADTDDERSDRLAVALIAKAVAAAETGWSLREKVHGS